MSGITIDGRPVETLSCTPAGAPEHPAFVRADIAPSRGMMLLQARLRLPDGRETDLLSCPPLEDLPRILDAGAEDFPGNRSFTFGAALLLPFANRIRGKPSGDREIQAEVLGKAVRLPANWGSRSPGAEPYAMHGLMLAREPVRLERQARPGGEAVEATFQPGDFAGHWLSRTKVTVGYVLSPGRLTLTVRATNVGEQLLPMGVGWHPYFALPSGRRDQARLRLPARARLEVQDYEAVLPTGRSLPVTYTPYDFSGPEGAPLGELPLDDCFVGLERTPGREVVVELRDPAANYGLRIRTPSREVSAVQVFSPADAGFVVVEPQFNWANPFGREWGGQDTGMVVLLPGAAVAYEVSLEPFTLVQPERRRKR